MLISLDMKYQVICIILSHLLFGHILAFASDDVYSKLKFGPEWTFTLRRTGIIDDFDRDELREKKKEIWIQYKKLCQNSKKCTVSGQKYYENFSVSFANGLNIEITDDPGVIEVKSNIHSLTEFQKLLPFVQLNVFDQFKKIKMTPHEREGAGHVNIDLNYFKDKPLLLYNFIVDFYNHPGLGLVLNSDSANSEDANYLNHFLERKHMHAAGFMWILYELPREIEKLGHSLSQKNSKVNSSDVISTFIQVLSQKYIALGLRSVSGGVFSDKSRMEVRVLRPQATALDYQLVLEIFSARIKYLSQQSEPLKLKPISSIDDGWVALGQYMDYIENAGLDYNKYKSLMPDVWRELNPKSFIRSNQKNNNRTEKIKCEGLF